MADPPVCPGLPVRTLQALKLFFEESLYSIWYSAQQTSFNTARADFVAAASALQVAIDAYNVQLAVRNVQYCDWKNELEAACHDFVRCAVSKWDYYRLELKPRVEADMNA